MKIAYFDCSSGAAGNMILGALIDAGFNPENLKQELKKLKLKGTNLIIKETKRGIIRGTFVDISIKEDDHNRNLKNILLIINQSRLSKQVKILCSKIFKRLAEAEAKVHRVPINQIHFHEVGAVDAIIDIVGSVIGLEILGVEKVFCSPLPYGKGNINHKHGILPNPAPATAELLKGIPTYGVNVQGELVTPTAAAILSTLVEDFINIPRMKVEKIGYGAGSKMFKGLFGQLRIFIGEAEIPTKKDTILQIETNIDDMNTKLYDAAIAQMMKAGALDVFITPIRMKKERVGHSLTILCSPELKDKMLDTLFSQTTTLGARVFSVPRETLFRSFIKVKTKYGTAKVKTGQLGKELKVIAPEYEDIKKLAAKHQIPIVEVDREVKWKIPYPGK